jgi:hypothetical protein
MPSGMLGVGAGLTPGGGGGGGPTLPTGWSQLRLGAGGQLVWIDVAADGTMLSMPDIHGLYVWDTTLPNTGNDSASRPLGRWRQAVTASSLSNIGSLPSQPPGNDFSGGIHVYAARMAPGNSSRMYMYMGNGYDGPGGYGYFYTSTDKGKTWTHRPLAPNFGANSQGNTKFLSPSMAVDPHNEQVVFMGITSHGLWKTADAGLNWTQVPTAQVAPPSVTVGGPGGGHIVCFDDSAWSSGNTQTIYASSYGVGVYRSINGGTTWTLLNSAGMPTVPGKVFVDRLGIVWVINSKDTSEYSVSIGKLFKYQSNAWIDVSTGDGSTYTGIPSNANDLRSVVVESTTSNTRKIIAVQKDTAQTSLSTDEGKTWAPVAYGPSKVVNDIPWLATTDEWEVAHLVHAADGNVWMAMGIGNFFAPLSAFSGSTPVAWTSRSAGNEELVAQWIISPPPPGNSNAVVSMMDRGVMHSPQVTYPNALIAGPMINHGRCCDYASSDPRFIVLSDGGGNITANASYSSDGGDSWTKFESFPGNGNFITSGAIAAATPANYVTFLNYSAGLWHTKNAGRPWTVYPMTVSSASYNNSTGVVTLNLPSAPALPLVGAVGVGNSVEVRGFSGTVYTVSSGTYDPATGTVAVTLATTPVFAVGATIDFLYSSGTGSYPALNGKYKITDITGNVVKYTWYTGGGAMTITGGTATASVNGLFTLTGVSGSTVTYNASSNLGSLTLTGGSIYGTGWSACGGLDPAGGWISFNADHRRCNVIADRVNVGTFYAYCDGANPTVQIAGFYKSTDGGTTWSLYSSGLYHYGYTPPGGDDVYAYEMQMRAMPGVAGNFYCSTGRFPETRQMPFYEIQDTGSTMTRTRVIGVDTVHAHGYGKAKPGNSYPSIYIWGRVAAAQDTAGIGGFGVWQSDDHCLHWTRLGTGYAGDSLDAAWVVSGDMNVYGKCYVGFVGTGVLVYNP